MKTFLQTLFFFLLVTQICFGQLAKNYPVHKQQNNKKFIKKTIPTVLSNSKFSNIRTSPNWVQYYSNYDNPVNTSFNSIAIDKEDNIIVLGSTEESFPRKNVTLRSCYNNSGQLQWQFKNDNLFIEQIVFDSLGNIYAQGNDSTGSFIMKLDSQWIVQWKIYDFMYYMIVDSLGNLYTTTSNELGSYLESEIVTKKYNSHGELQWERKYSRINESINFPAKLEFTSSGEVVVFGLSYIPNGECPQTVFIKYSADGTEKNKLSFNETKSCWYTKTLAVDESGSIFIATAIGDLPNTNTCLRKYGSTGILQWTSTTNGFPRDLVLDDNGSVYVVNESNRLTTVKFDKNGLQQWKKNLNLPYQYSSSVNGISLDADNNLYIVGTSDSLGLSKILAVKYDPHGNEKWIFNYPESEKTAQLGDIKMKSNGEIFAVGGNNEGDGILFKINANGVLEWEAKYEGTKYPYDIAIDIMLDSLKNIYVSGVSGIEQSKGIILKYDHLGNLQWKKEILTKKPFASPIMKTTNDGSIYYSYSFSSEEEENVRFLSLLKFESDGSLNWQYEYRSSSGVWQLDPVQILVDYSGNAYIFSNRAGPNLESAILIQKFSQFGNLIWTKEILDMQISSKETLSIDRNNQLYISINGTNDRIINFMKYNEHGERLWIKEFDPGPNGWCFPRNLFLDENGYEYILGFYHDTGNEKLLTIKYDSLGNQQWFNILETNSTTMPLEINVDNNDDVFVACLISDSSWNDTFGLIKYDKEGTKQWMYKEYLGYNSNTFDTEFDTDGNIYFVSSNGNMVISKYSKDGVLAWREEYVNSKWDFLWESPQKIIFDKEDHLNIVGTSQQWMVGFNAHWVASSIITTLQYDISITSLENTNSNVPLKFNLEQNYPNPFNPTTKISWQSPVSDKQVLKIFDVLGNEIATLVDEEKEAGYHSIDFDARELPSGVYFYQLRVGSFVEAKKMILLR